MAVELPSASASKKLSYDTLHDAMTGLPNRALFLELLSEAISLARRRRAFSFAVLFIDIDHFKVVNDSLGHMVGDQLLWAIGARLKGALRSTDTLARFGGDEFAILLDTSGYDEGANAPERCSGLQQEFRVQGQAAHVCQHRHSDVCWRDAKICCDMTGDMSRPWASRSELCRAQRKRFLRLT
jgi:diguanylate cyclase (GGDEF)-like protein